MLQENEGRTALVESSFAVTGMLKLLGLQTRMVRRWGVQPRAMQRLGAIEVVGSLMVARNGTRPLGAAALAAVSAMLLVMELRHREVELVLPRMMLTCVAAVTAVAAGQAHRTALARRP